MIFTSLIEVDIIEFTPPSSDFKVAILVPLYKFHILIVPSKDPEANSLFYNIDKHFTLDKWDFNSLTYYQLGILNKH